MFSKRMIKCFVNVLRFKKKERKNNKMTCYFVLTDFMKKEKEDHVDAVHFVFVLGLFHFCLNVVSVYKQICFLRALSCDSTDSLHAQNTVCFLK